MELNVFTLFWVLRKWLNGFYVNYNIFAKITLEAFYLKIVLSTSDTMNTFKIPFRALSEVII